MVVRSVRPISNSDGEYPQAGFADLYANNAFSGCFSFFRKDLTVPTARFTSPLDCGKQGLLVMCPKPHSFAKLVNSADVYCGSLSLHTSSGIPCLAKIAFKALITS